MNCLQKINRARLLIFSLSATTIGFVISGIVGNKADALFLKALALLKKTVVLDSTWQIVVICLLPIFAISIILLGLIAIRYYRSQQAALNLVRLDDTLLRLLSSFTANPDKQAATKLLFQEFLTDTLELFEDGCRISIMRPDDDDPEWLVIWQSLRVPFETVHRTRLYIGSNHPHPKTGIAGKVFLTQKHLVVHLSWDRTNSRWSPDDPDYVPFISRTTRRSVPYKAIAAMPIIESIDDSGKTTCIGVLCLDSSDATAFDSNEILDGLSSVSERILAILKILENYN